MVPSALPTYDIGRGRPVLGGFGMAKPPQSFAGDAGAFGLELQPTATAKTIGHARRTLMSPAL
jgi:hypothetical protein